MTPECTPADYSLTTILGSEYAAAQPVTISLRLTNVSGHGCVQHADRGIVEFGTARGQLLGDTMIGRTAPDGRVLAAGASEEVSVTWRQRETRGIYQIAVAWNGLVRDQSFAID